MTIGNSGWNESVVCHKRNWNGMAPSRSFIRPEMEGRKEGEKERESPWVQSRARSPLDPWLASRRFPCPSQTDEGIQTSPRFTVTFHFL